MRNLRKGKRVDELRAIEQQLAQARATLALSTSELKRNETLVAQGFLSRNQARRAALRPAIVIRRASPKCRRSWPSARDAARPDEIAAAEAEQRAAESDLRIVALARGPDARHGGTHGHGAGRHVSTGRVGRPRVRRSSPCCPTVH